jgi:glycosyltransferase involved in cell wall biosynthesis
MLAEEPSLEIVVQTSDPAPAPAGVRKVSRFRDHAELNEYYRRAAVVAIASVPNLYTSGSTVALEAQAVGRPVVISNTPGMDSYVKDGRSGFLTRPGDHRELATAVLNIVRNPEQGDQMGRVGSARVRSENTILSMTEHIARVFDIVLARPA